jgi:hypothetical protein
MKTTTLNLGKYRHYKGKEYEVIGIAKHSETLEDMVVYKALYESDKFEEDQMWVRPLSMFTEKIIIDGNEIFRFEYINK